DRKYSKPFPTVRAFILNSEQFNRLAIDIEANGKMMGREEYGRDVPISQIEGLLWWPGETQKERGQLVGVPLIIVREMTKASIAPLEKVLEHELDHLYGTLSSSV